jgi:hypothetical protein
VGRARGVGAMGGDKGKTRARVRKDDPNRVRNELSLSLADRVWLGLAHPLNELQKEARIGLT